MMGKYSGGGTSAPPAAPTTERTPWPMLATRAPAEPSRKRRPSAVSIHTPSARTTRGNCVVERRKRCPVVVVITSLTGHVRGYESSIHRGRYNRSTRRPGGGSTMFIHQMLDRARRLYPNKEAVV